MTQFPRIAIDLHLSDARVDLIADAFDIVLRIGILEDSALVSRRLSSIPLLMVAAPAYLDRNGRPTHPAQLVHHSCFGYAYARGRNGLRFRHAGGEEVVVRMSGALQANNGDAVMPAIIAGLGIAALPAFISGAAVADGRLEVILSEWGAPGSSLHLLTAPGTPQPLRVKLLADFLARHLTGVCHSPAEPGS